MMLCRRDTMDNSTEGAEAAGPHEKEKDKDGLALSICPNVHSTAVMKYVSVDRPARFSQLQVNTNLNEPPANWLHGGSKWESYLRDISLGKDHSRFSSFNMAHCFPDMAAAEVDVISDAENIKKLLKIPYSKGDVSMMVHRIGRTVLLDDFDIHKHLLRKQEDDWKWMRQFFYDTILENMAEKEKYCVTKKNKSRDHLQNRNMFSKFLYYSIADNEETESTEHGHSSHSHHFEALEKALENTASQFPPDPLPEPQAKLTDHQRAVLWSFEHLHMLIGTDLPIFGAGTHPCISLRLRDMKKPINVLTGLDYWLDNLMCNVPEIAMCYHLDGFVQSYEVIKTEDIPNISDSKFSPTVVKDVAQNILSFLKSNATKEGHTYWLFKGSGEDVVKLYDLTTLCADLMEDRNANPFTVPVGILLYRVARNMRQTQGRKHSGTIRKLLENCLLLLDKDTYPQVVTSANYLLSDLYIPDDINNKNFASTPEGESEYEQEAEEEQELTEEPPEKSVNVQALCIPDSVQKNKEVARYPPIAGNYEQRCREALKHVAEGLSCLDNSVVQKTPEPEPEPEPDPEPAASKHTVEPQKKCNPSEAIPLHYESLDKTKEMSAKLSTNSDTDNWSPDHDPSEGDNQVSVFTRASLPLGSWQCLSKMLLLRKAAVAYYGLADSKFASHKYGQALKYIKLGLTCFEAMRVLSSSKAEECHELLTSLVGLAADVHLMVAPQTQLHEAMRDEYRHLVEQDRIICDSAHKIISDFEYGWLSELTPYTERNLSLSASCYELAIALTKQSTQRQDAVNGLTKRFGNVQNELGVFFMNKAFSLMNEEDQTAGNGCGEPKKEVCDLWRQGFQCLERGIQAFESLQDKVNMALLHSNYGRLMRLCAQGHIQYDQDGQRKEFSQQERHYYNKAIEQYQIALDLLKVRSSCAKIWDSIVWDLSSTYFNMATQMQDYAPLATLSQEQVEKEVTDLMMKALKYCDCASPRQPTCQYRAATVHHRLASLYHNSYRNQNSDQRRKHLRCLADLHYNKASSFFSIVDSPCELMRVQLERVAMCEYHFAGQTSVHAKAKTLQTALDSLIQCRTSLASMDRQMTEGEENSTDYFDAYRDEADKLLAIFESRLQFILLHLVKTLSSNKKSKPSDQQDLAAVKAMYATVLRNSEGTKTAADLHARCCHLLQTVDQLRPPKSTKQEEGPT